MRVYPDVDREPDIPQAHRKDGLRVLFVAAEIYPMAKTGGLADVCASLPPQLAGQGMDVRLLMPGYGEAMEQIAAPQVVADLGEVLPGAPVRLIAGWTPDSGLPIWVIDSPKLFQRPGSVYQDPAGRDWEDNALRFGVLCHVAAMIGAGRASLGWLPDIVHGHDWHAGLIPLLLRRAGTHVPKTVFTVHNAAFQGCFPLECAAQLCLPRDVINAGDAEFYGNLSFLKAGVRYADAVTTVSPTYAREIQTPEYGVGLEGLYQSRNDVLVGIMNGIDAELWNPASDPYLPCAYSAGNIGGKRLCKASLQDHSGLHVDSRAPLVAFVSRLTGQKMADVLLAHLPDIMERNPRLQLAIHGRGERALEEGFKNFANDYPGRLSVRIGYEEAHAHRLQAGADILLHGARFEPCGLTQLYAMRYGTIPVVRRVGGLADSVIDFESPEATGFAFNEATGEAMHRALLRSVETYQDQPEAWSAMQARSMASDFSWNRSAKAYVNLYSRIVPDPAVEKVVHSGEIRSVKNDVKTGFSRKAPVPVSGKKQVIPISNYG